MMLKLVHKMSKPDGLLYFPNVLSVDDERGLIKLFQDTSDWKTAGIRANRLVKHYGYNYPYTRKLELTPADPIPIEIQNIIQRVVKLSGLEHFQPDQAIVNRYLTNEGISPHIDHTDLFGDIVVSVSIGCRGTMRFRSNGQKYDIKVEPRSVYAMTGDARYKWTHEMLKSKSQCGTRFSITFRKINQKFLKK